MSGGWSRQPSQHNSTTNSDTGKIPSIHEEYIQSQAAIKKEEANTKDHSVATSTLGPLRPNSRSHSESSRLDQAKHAHTKVVHGSGLIGVGQVYWYVFRIYSTPYIAVAAIVEKSRALFQVLREVERFQKWLPSSQPNPETNTL